MECRQCSKVLNEMTVICDRCGSQQKESKPTFTFRELDKLIIFKKVDEPYPTVLQEYLKRAFFLSNIRSEESNSTKKAIDKYLDYIYLRLMYEKDKNILLTNNYPVEKANAILSSLVTMKCTKEMKGYIKEEFLEVYDKKELPQEVISRIEDVFIMDYNLKQIIPKNSTKLFQQILKEEKLFFKHIQSNGKKRLKTLKYRMKKGKKK